MLMDAKLEKSVMKHKFVGITKTITKYALEIILNAVASTRVGFFN